jgi:hypothetical protein
MQTIQPPLSAWRAWDEETPIDIRDSSKLDIHY